MYKISGKDGQVMAQYNNRKIMKAYAEKVLAKRYGAAANLAPADALQPMSFGA
ncbi:MAG: hypothetical protein LBU32_10430 [Clostridiales bacterium]|jgi:hypothetical protein|nr:hypothetical protein [Clostridiales bacterium]